MNAYENGILVLVRDSDSILKREEDVGVTSHDDFEAALFESRFQKLAHFEVIASFGPE